MGFQVFLKFVNGAVHDIDWQIIPDCWCCHFKSCHFKSPISWLISHFFTPIL